ncbi:hypothetical protein PHYBOEH_009067 [Phytophthora boehmeriae]|uniref:Uncharacterized protein n=1 Tax=Phytophthora boehmeriae TaxID=109152 RepID=A0A8T1W0G8_9STRA|nr:hypothetical protein PHYBOEH_009067 [Phytophthora boehmeriae]
MRTLSSPQISPTQCIGSPSVTCTASSSNMTDYHQDSNNSNIYVRAWKFVQRRLHLRPRASSCPLDMESRATSSTESSDSSSTTGVSSSYCADWRRVHLLKELEAAGARAQWRRQQQQYHARQDCIQETAEWTPTDDVQVQPTFRTLAQRKTAQTTCSNCGLMFFRPLAVALDTSAFCSRDCQSSFEYLRDLQDVVDDRNAFQSPVGWTQSSEL